MELKKVQKQGRDERMQEEYPTSAVYFCRCRVVFLRSFISTLFLYFFQLHPYLKSSLQKNFSPSHNIGRLFGDARCTACPIVNEMCTVIVQRLFKQYISIPSGNSLDEVVQGFADVWSFPQYAGAIDRSYIPIQAPSECPKDYYTCNRKGFHSILLQGLADHRYCFLDINIGWPGLMHDVQVLANSELLKNGQNGALFPQQPKLMKGLSVLLLVVGDPTYPLLPWIMKPYSNTGRVSRQQRLFNYRLSCARVVIENAFGTLKGHLQCLLKQNDTNLDMMSTVVAVCTMLHNV